MLCIMACCVLAAELQRLLGSRGNSRIVAAFVRKVLDAATRRDGNGKASKVQADLGQFVEADFFFEKIAPLSLSLSLSLRH